MVEELATHEVGILLFLASAVTQHTHDCIDGNGSSRVAVPMPSDRDPEATPSPFRCHIGRVTYEQKRPDQLICSSQKSLPQAIFIRKYNYFSFPRTLRIRLEAFARDNRRIVNDNATIQEYNSSRSKDRPS
jgi:hypothetical protein